MPLLEILPLVVRALVLGFARWVSFYSNSLYLDQVDGLVSRMAMESSLSALWLFHTLSSVGRLPFELTAVRGCERLPAEPPRARGAGSVAPYSLPVTGPQTPLLVQVTARCASQVANSRHLLPHGSTARDAVGVQLDPHHVGVEFIEIHHDVKDVLGLLGLHLYVAEV